MNSAKISNLLEQIKTYCPHTSDWKVYDTNISYMEHSKETIIMLEGRKPEEYLQEMLDRIAPSNEKILKMLREPIDLKVSEAEIRHTLELRNHMLKEAYDKKQIAEKDYAELRRAFEWTTTQK